METPDEISPERQPVDALQAHLKTARFFLTGRQYERATNAAQKALTVDPDCAECHAILAICAARLGDGDKARYEADLALALGPDDVYNCYASVVAAQYQKDWARGEADARRGLEIKPDYDYLHFRLGQILKVQNRFAEAYDSLAEAIRLAPENADYHLRMSQLLISTRHWDQGSAYLHETLRLDPENSEAQTLLGLMQVKNRELQTGQQTLRSSLSLNPQDVFTQRFLRYLETTQQPFFRLFDHTRHAPNEVKVEGVTALWTGLGPNPHIFGWLVLIVSLIGELPALLKAFFYLLFCACTILEIYHWVASEILWRQLPDKQGRPSFGQRVKMVFIAASYAFLHFMYWWLPTIF